MTTLLEFDPARASGDQWQQLFALHQVAARSDHPADPTVHLALWRKSIEASARDPQIDYWMLAINDRLGFAFHEQRATYELELEQTAKRLRL